MSRQERFEEQVLGMMQALWARQDALGQCLDEVDVSVATLVGVLETKGLVAPDEFAGTRAIIAAAKAKMAKARADAEKAGVPVPDLLAGRVTPEFGGQG